MKLYDVPRNSKIRIVEDPKTPVGSKTLREGEILEFLHIDGIYSLCLDQDGNPVHLSAFAEVEILKNM
jgi:hypothetical protein